MGITRVLIIISFILQALLANAQQTEDYLIPETKKISIGINLAQPLLYNFKKFAQDWGIVTLKVPFKYFNLRVKPQLIINPLIYGNPNAALTVLSIGSQYRNRNFYLRNVIYGLNIGAERGIGLFGEEELTFLYSADLTVGISNCFFDAEAYTVVLDTTNTVQKISGTQVYKQAFYNGVKLAITPGIGIQYRLSKQLFFSYQLYLSYYFFDQEKYLRLNDNNDRLLYSTKNNIIKWNPTNFVSLHYVFSKRKKENDTSN